MPKGSWDELITDESMRTNGLIPLMATPIGGADGM